MATGTLQREYEKDIMIVNPRQQMSMSCSPSSCSSVLTCWTWSTGGRWRTPSSSTWFSCKNILTEGKHDFNFLYNALVVRCVVFGECFLTLVIGQPSSWCSLLIGRSYGKRKAQLQLRRNASNINDDCSFIYLVIRCTGYGADN